MQSGQGGSVRLILLVSYLGGQSDLVVSGVGRWGLVAMIPVVLELAIVRVFSRLY